jgi:glycosyltransferase involved in cell wall biosynthesis
MGTLRGQLRFLREQGFDVHVVSSPSDEAARFVAAEGGSFIPVEMRREIAPLHDLRALWRLWRVLRRLRPDICQVGMPKAGLLGGLAAWLARVPCRVYMLHGLRLETLSGGKRLLLTWAERVACRAAHRVVCVSESLRRRAVELGIVADGRCAVLGAGSANGVDVERFAVSEELCGVADQIRDDLGIPKSASVVGFVGRLTRDKGIYELVQAFERLKKGYPNLHLLLVGAYEEGDPVPHATRMKIAIEPRVLRVGHVNDTAPYYHAMDLVALPSCREGLPTVVLEAGAAGKPVVGSRATGMADAVEDGRTGLLAPVGDVAALAEKLAKLLDDPAWSKEMGNAARQHVAKNFRQENVWTMLAAFYHSLLPAQDSDVVQRVTRGALADSRTHST